LQLPWFFTNQNDLLESELRIRQNPDRGPVKNADRNNPIGVDSGQLKKGQSPRFNFKVNLTEEIRCLTWFSFFAKVVHHHHDLSDLNGC
jgi:hypothetical protein